MYRSSIPIPYKKMNLAIQNKLLVQKLIVQGVILMHYTVRSSIKSSPGPSVTPLKFTCPASCRML